MRSNAVERINCYEAIVVNCYEFVKFVVNFTYEAWSVSKQMVLNNKKISKTKISCHQWELNS